MIKKLNTGCMPNTDFNYEEFEGLLASYYLSYVHLKESSKPVDQENFKKLEDILNRLAERHSVQLPAEAISNVRATETWAKPKKLSYFSVKDMLNSFYRDFGIVGRNADDTADVKALAELVRSPEMEFIGGVI
jgi:hypothetical protein